MKKGDRLCHVITPRDKAGALKKSTKKAGALDERREIFCKKQDATKPEMKRRAGAEKKKLRPGSKRGIEKRRRVKGD